MGAQYYPFFTIAADLANAGCIAFLDKIRVR